MFPRKYTFTVYFSDFGRTICGHTCTQREIYSTFARSRASQKLFSITLSTVTARILFRSQARALLTVRRLSTIPALSLRYSGGSSPVTSLETFSPAVVHTSTPKSNPEQPKNYSRRLLRLFPTATCYSHPLGVFNSRGAAAGIPASI